MNDLQRLFKARGLSMRKLAAAIGEGYHPTQKNVLGVRKQRHIQNSVAAYLGLTVEQCFGPNAASYLKPLISCEINRKRVEYANKLKARYLDPTIAGESKTVNG